jgi:hypothetical protein
MRWWQLALLGAGGGVIVEALSLFKWFAVWQSARRSASGTLRADPPALAQYVDVPAHAAMLVLRAVLGAASAAIFAAGGQIRGAYVAVALGFCGPALLGRLGEIPQVASAVAGEQQAPERRSAAESAPAAGGTGSTEVVGEH